MLFSILEGNDEPCLRANIIIAIGDITRRFANIIKPWLSYIYKRLRDADTRVRKNTLYEFISLAFFVFHRFFSNLREHNENYLLIF